MTTHDSDNASSGDLVDRLFALSRDEDDAAVRLDLIDAANKLTEAAARIRELEKENGALKAALSIARPHVLSAKDAEHMLDGFKPRSRPIDDQLRVVDAALAAQPSTPAEDEKV